MRVPKIRRVGLGRLRYMTLMESRGICGRPLSKSLLPDYAFQCFTCDEDFYNIEQNI